MYDSVYSAKDSPNDTFGGIAKARKILDLGTPISLQISVLDVWSPPGDIKGGQCAQSDGNMEAKGSPKTSNWALKSTLGAQEDVKNVKKMHA